MNLSHYVLLKSFFVTARVVWAEIFTEVERVFLRRNISTIWRQIYLAAVKLPTGHENKNAT